MKIFLKTQGKRFIIRHIQKDFLKLKIGEKYFENLINRNNKIKI
jgi:hypothetical protein